MRATTSITPTGVLATAAVLLAGCQLPASSTSSEGQTPTAAGLAGLAIAAETTMDGYDRDEQFGDWEQRPNIAEHDWCDTREIVLYRQGTDVERDSACAVTSGTWTSAYTGETLTDVSDVEIDHMVPLAEAWRSGAADWDQDRRVAFANDLTRPQLVAVDGSSNASKSDSDPAGWRPDIDECGYARDWIAVKAHLRLPASSTEVTGWRQPDVGSVRLSG